MKQFYQLILLLLFGMHLNSNAQCVRGIRTNPNDPLNTEFDLTYPGRDNPFVNKFDWAKNNGLAFNIIELNPNAGWAFGSYNMANPYSMYMPTEYEYLWKPNGKMVPIDELDWHWENGWELMALNTGYYPDGTEINNPNPNSILSQPMILSNDKVPYYMLYNRYTGKLRMFSGLFTPFGSVGGVYMKVGYVNKKEVSGILRSLGNYDRTLDYPSKNTGVTTYNRNLNNSTTWFSSDVQLSYDPCVCNYATTMNLSFDAIKTFSVKLYGRELSVERALSVAPKDFLSQTSINQNSENGSNLLYKELDKMYADYQQQLQDYDIKMKDYNSIQNQIKREVISLAREGFANGVAGAIPGDKVKAYLVQHSFSMFGKKIPDEKTAEGWTKLIRDGAKGLAGQGFDFLSMALFGKDNKPVAPTMPTATFSEMRISGEISESNVIHIANFYTPGSYNPSEKLPLHSPHYPIYNEAVGLFALLERPSFDLYHNLKYEDVRVRNTDLIRSVFKYNSDGTQYLTYDTTQIPGVRSYAAHTATYMKLNAPLKYRFNHAVDFNWEKTKVYVAFEVEYYMTYSWLNKSPAWDRFDSISYTYQSGNLEPLHIYDSLDIVHLRSYNSYWIPIDKIGQQVLGVEFVDSLIQRRNPGIEKFYYSIDQVKELWPPRIRRIKMKIMADMYFNQLSYQGDEINTTQVFTYLLFDKGNETDVTSTQTDIASKQDIVKYTLGEVILDAQTVYPYSPYVTSVLNNEIFMDGEQFTIAGDIAVAPGYKLNIRSFNGIEVLDGVHLSPEMTLEHKRDYFSTPLTTEVSDADLTTYCSGNTKKYAAGSTMAKQEESDNDLETKENNSPFINSQVIRVFPNPVSDGLNIYFEHVQDGPYSILVTNLVGIEYFYTQEQVTGQSNWIINTSSLPDGMYFVKVSGPATTICKPIIIQH